MVADVVVGAVLPVGLHVSGVVDVLYLLFEGGLLGVLHAAGQGALLDVTGQRLHGDLAGDHVAGQAGQYVIAGSRFFVPDDRVLRGHLEGDGRGGQVALGRLGLGEAIGAVVQALEGEDAATGHRSLVGLKFAGGRVLLLQLELGAGQIIASFVHLVHVHLVGEHDHGVLGRGLIFGDGRAVVVIADDVAIGHVGGVDVAMLADCRGVLQHGIKGQLHLRAVQGLGDRVAGPGQLLGEGFAGLRSNIRRGDGVGDVHAGRVPDRPHEIAGRFELAGLQRVVEGDLVGFEVGNVVGQLGIQPEGHGVADVIVGAVLPAGPCRLLGVVDIRNCLAEFRLGNGGIGDAVAFGLRGVAKDGLLLDGIDVLDAVIVRLRQVGEAEVPNSVGIVLALLEFPGLHQLGLILGLRIQPPVQVDGDAFRLIAAVCPGLGAVDDGEAVGVGVGDADLGRIFRAVDIARGLAVGRIDGGGSGAGGGRGGGDAGLVARLAVVRLGHHIPGAVGQALNGDGLTFLQGDRGLTVDESQLVVLNLCNRGICGDGSHLKRLICQLIALGIGQADGELKDTGGLFAIGRGIHNALADLQVARGIPVVADHNGMLEVAQRAGNGTQLVPRHIPILRMRDSAVFVLGLADHIPQVGVLHRIVILVGQLSDGEVGVQGQARNGHDLGLADVLGMVGKAVVGADIIRLRRAAVQGDVAHAVLATLVRDKLHIAVGSDHRGLIVVLVLPPQLDLELERVGGGNVVAGEHLQDGQLGLLVAGVGDGDDLHLTDIFILLKIRKLHILEAVDDRLDLLVGTPGVFHNAAVVGAGIVVFIDGVGHARGQAIQQQAIAHRVGVILRGGGQYGDVVFLIFILRAIRAVVPIPGDIFPAGHIQHAVLEVNREFVLAGILGLDVAREGRVGQLNLDGEPILLVRVAAGRLLDDLQCAVGVLGVGHLDGLGGISRDHMGFGIIRIHDGRLAVALIGFGRLRRCRLDDGIGVAACLFLQRLIDGILRVNRNPGEDGRLAGLQADADFLFICERRLISVFADLPLAAGAIGEFHDDREGDAFVHRVAIGGLGDHQVAGLVGVGHLNPVCRHDGLLFAASHNGANLLVVVLGIQILLLLILGQYLLDLVGGADINASDLPDLILGQLEFAHISIRFGIPVEYDGCLLMRVLGGRVEGEFCNRVAFPILLLRNGQGSLEIEFLIAFGGGIRLLRDGQAAVFVEGIGHQHDRRLLLVVHLEPGISIERFVGLAVHLLDDDHIILIAVGLLDPVLRAVGQVADHSVLVRGDCERGDADALVKIRHKADSLIAAERQAVRALRAAERGIVYNQLELKGACIDAVALQLLADGDTRIGILLVGIHHLDLGVIATPNGAGGLLALHGGRTVDGVTGLVSAGGLEDLKPCAVADTLDGEGLIGLQRDRIGAGLEFRCPGDRLAAGLLLGIKRFGNQVVAILQRDGEGEGIVNVVAGAIELLADHQVAIGIPGIGEGSGRGIGGNDAGLALLVGDIAFAGVDHVALHGQAATVVLHFLHGILQADGQALDLLGRAALEADQRGDAVGELHFGERAVLHRIGQLGHHSGAALHAGHGDLEVEGIVAGIVAVDLLFDGQIAGLLGVGEADGAVFQRLLDAGVAGHAQFLHVIRDLLGLAARVVFVLGQAGELAAWLVGAEGQGLPGHGGAVRRQLHPYSDAGRPVCIAARHIDPGLADGQPGRGLGVGDGDPAVGQLADHSGVAGHGDLLHAVRDLGLAVIRKLGQVFKGIAGMAGVECRGLAGHVLAVRRQLDRDRDVLGPGIAAVGIDPRLVHGQFDALGGVSVHKLRLRHRAVSGGRRRRGFVFGCSGAVHRQLVAIRLDAALGEGHLGAHGHVLDGPGVRGGTGRVRHRKLFAVEAVRDLKVRRQGVDAAEGLRHLNAALLHLGVGDGQRVLLRGLVQHALAVVGIGDDVVEASLLQGLLVLDHGIGQGVLLDIALAIHDTLGRGQVLDGPLPVVVLAQLGLIVGLLRFGGDAILVGLDDHEGQLDAGGLFRVILNKLLLHIDVGALGNQLVGDGDLAAGHALTLVGIGGDIALHAILDDGILVFTAIVVLGGQLVPDIGGPLAVPVRPDGNGFTDLLARPVGVDAPQLQLDALVGAGLIEVVAVAHPGLGGADGGVLVLHVGRRPGGQVGNGGHADAVGILAGVVQRPRGMLVVQLVGFRHLFDFAVLILQILIQHEVMVVIIAGIILRRGNLLPGIQPVLVQAFPLGKATRSRSLLFTANRCVTGDPEGYGVAVVMAVHLPQQLIPPGLGVCLAVGQVANGQLALIQLELCAGQPFGDVVLVDLVQAEEQAIDRDTGVHGLHGMRLGDGIAVAAAADQGRRVREGILALGTGIAGVGQGQGRPIRDVADGQQPGVVVVGDVDALRRLVTLVMDAHGIGIKIHVGVNVVRQGQGFTVVQHIAMGVDLDGILDVPAGFVIITDNQSVRIGFGAVGLGDVALGGDGHLVGGVKRDVIARGDGNLVFKYLLASRRAGDVIPLFIGELSVIFYDNLLIVQTIVLIRVGIIRIVSCNIGPFDLICVNVDSHIYLLVPTQFVARILHIDRGIAFLLRIIVEQCQTLGNAILKPYPDRVGVRERLLGRVELNLPLNNAILFGILAILDQVDLRSMVSLLGIGFFAIVQPDLIMHHITINDLDGTQEREIDMYTFIQYRECEQRIGFIDSIIDAGSQNGTVIRSDHSVERIKISSVKIVLPVPALVAFSDGYSGSIPCFANGDVLQRIRGFGVLFHDDVPIDLVIGHIPVVEFLADLGVVSNFLRELNHHLGLNIAKLVVGRLGITDAGFLRLILGDDLAIVFNGDGALADVLRQAILEQQDLVLAVLAIVPESPVVAVLGPLAGAGRHGERGVIRLLDVDATHQLLQVGHVVFDDRALQVHAGLAIGQRIVDGAAHIHNLAIDIGAFLRDRLGLREGFKFADALGTIVLVSAVAGVPDLLVAIDAG